MSSRLSYGERLEKERSPKLANLLAHFQFQDDALARKPFLTMRELADLGVTLIALPDVDSLLSAEEHFRPTQTFGPDTNAPVLDLMGGNPVLGRKTIVAQLFDITKEMISDEHKSKDENSNVNLMGWSLIQDPSGFYDLLDDAIRTSTFDRNVWEWSAPYKTRRTPPYIRMRLHHYKNFQKNSLLANELKQILLVVYCRLYQLEFKDETIFPIQIFSGNNRRQMRVIEAVFDQSRQKLTIKVTPAYSFVKKEKAPPWGVFMSLAASAPLEGLPRRVEFNSSQK